jgi:hypothetical protein
MEILSGNSFDLRSAVYTFTHPTLPHQFITFPMVHIGDPTFYHQVHQRLHQCDIILYEGINSRMGSLGIKAYELLAKNLGLALQKTELKKQGLEHTELICADLYKQEFEGYWKKIPLHERVFYNGFMFIQHLYQMASVTKDIIANNLTLTLREDASSFTSEHLQDLIIKKRDRRLIHHIERQMDIHQGVTKTIGVVFGAVHIQAVMRYLIDQHKYKVKDAEWLIVFHT